MALKFYKCEICGNLVCKVTDSGNIMSCCGRPMRELRPGSTDGAVEKHVPVYTTEKSKVLVKVGEIAHPMDTLHHIEFIAIETTSGFQVKRLNLHDVPEACFKICLDDEILGVYAYCNLHGMFMTT